MISFDTGCIEKIYSVSALVGDDSCNANCGFCAGKYLRKDARENVHNERYYSQLESAIKLSSAYGGWSLSLTSSGEPTCSPEALTKALQTYDKCASQGRPLPNVNLFTNGILFGDDQFCAEYLDKWRDLGLNNVAVSIHGVTEEEQAAAYNLDSYPKLEKIFENIREHNLGVRCTLLLRKDGVDDDKKYESAVHTLIDKSVDNITSWPVGNPDGSRSRHTPSRLNLFKIQRWLRKNAVMCHGHAWGGGVFDFEGNILRYTDYVTKHDRKKNFVRQLVVFQDGTVSYSWIKKGALCLK